jgi:hypothetical protein
VAKGRAHQLLRLDLRRRVRAGSSRRDHDALTERSIVVPARALRARRLRSDQRQRARRGPFRTSCSASSIPADSERAVRCCVTVCTVIRHVRNCRVSIGYRRGSGHKTQPPHAHTFINAPTPQIIMDLSAQTVLKIAAVSSVRAARRSTPPCCYLSRKKNIFD